MRFGDHLRSWPPEALGELLSARPDLLAAAGNGFDALARRAASPVSLGRCLIRSDVGMLVVAEALAVASPASAAEVDELLGTGDVDGVVDALGRLQRRGLVVVDEGVASPVGALVELFTRPLGLGQSFVDGIDSLPPEVLDRLAAELGVAGARSRSATARAVARRLRDPRVLGPLLDGLPGEPRKLLDLLIGYRTGMVELPLGARYQAPDALAEVPAPPASDGDDEAGDGELIDPRTWLLAWGLLVPTAGGMAEVPREIIMGANPKGLAPGAALRPIRLRPVVGLTADVVSAAGADQAGTFLDQVEALLRLAVDGQIAVRRAGGVGIRELGRLARLLGSEPEDVGRLLELLHGARLLTPGRTALTATELAGTWWQLSRARRWLVLVRSWLASSGFASLALSPDGQGDTRAALDTGADPVAAVAATGRLVLLEAVTSLADGEAFAPDQLAESVVWRSPNLWGTGDPPPEDLIGWTLSEAALLGLVAENAPVPALRALVAGDDAALEVAAAAALGADQDRIVLQSDLTAVALGPLDPRVAQWLDQMADRVAGRSVATYRFSEASVRRAFDRGWTAARLEALLADHALSGVPQPLSYLLADVERRYGSVRVLAATSVLVTADEALAVEVASSRRAARLGLRLIAPTVLIGPVDPHQMVEELRAEGWFPVLDGDRLTLHAVDPALDPDADTGAGTVSGAVVGAAASSRPDPLPADWTGPPLHDAALPGEVAELVEGLLADETARPETTLEGQLQRQWNRPTIVRHRRDGRLAEARGVLVGLDGGLTLLCETGIEELPLDAVVAVEDPAR